MVTLPLAGIVPVQVTVWFACELLIDELRLVPLSAPPDVVVVTPQEPKGLVQPIALNPFGSVATKVPVIGTRVLLVSVWVMVFVLPGPIGAAVTGGSTIPIVIGGMRT